MKNMLVWATCSCILAACGGGDDQDLLPPPPTGVGSGNPCGASFQAPVLSAGQTYALTFITEQLEERLYPRRAAVLASALPGVQFGTEQERTVQLSPFDAQDPQREMMRMQVQAPFIDGSALCLKNTTRTLTPGATLDNYPFPQLQTTSAYQHQFVWEAFEASWRNFPATTAKVSFTIHADKYPAIRSADTQVHICQSVQMFINRTQLECAAVQRTDHGADVLVEAILPLPENMGAGSGPVYDFFLIANKSRGHISEYPWNPLPR